MCAFIDVIIGTTVVHSSQCSLFDLIDQVRCPHTHSYDIVVRIMAQLAERECKMLGATPKDRTSTGWWSADVRSFK